MDLECEGISKKWFRNVRVSAGSGAKVGDGQQNVGQERDGIGRMWCRRRRRSAGIGEGV